MKKTINIFLNASVYYVIFRFLIKLVFIFNTNIAETITYHYSENLFWYFIWFVFPILASILISIKLQFDFFRQIGIFLIPALAIGTLISGFLNKQYWGYWYKRPTVFNEIKEATSIISITDISKTTEEDEFSIELDTSVDNEFCCGQDLYYANFERAILIFQNNASQYPDLYDWYEITKDTNKKITKSELKIISNTIQNSDVFIKPKSKSYESANNFKGKIIEFKTENNNFYYIALASGEVQNDHYPFYEILINADNLDKIIKKQIFYTDFAGFEGFEYANVASLFEFLELLLIGLIVFVKRKKDFNK